MNAGLHEPEYFCNAFILQTVIYNKNYKKPDKYLINRAIQERNPAIQIEKLSIENLRKAFLNRNYRKNTIENILAVYNDIDTSQIFGAPEIEKILDCPRTTAKEIMKKIRDMEIVVEIKGNGKGKYRFIYENEI